MSALIVAVRRWLRIAPRQDFATRLDHALADLDPIALRVEAWERSLPLSTPKLETLDDGRNV